MCSKIRKERCNQKGELAQRSCDGNGSSDYEELKASSIAKQVVGQGWTNKDRLHHLRLVGNAEKWFYFYPESNNKLLKGFQ